MRSRQKRPAGNVDTRPGPVCLGAAFALLGDGEGDGTGEAAVGLGAAGAWVLAARVACCAPSPLPRSVSSPAMPPITTISNPASTPATIHGTFEPPWVGVGYPGPGYALSCRGLGSSTTGRPSPDAVSGSRNDLPHDGQ